MVLLFNYVNKESLEICFHELEGKKATGVDEVSKEKYSKNLSTNLDASVETKVNVL